MNDHWKVVFKFYINDMKMVSSSIPRGVWLCVIQALNIKYSNCTVNPSKSRARFETAPTLYFLLYFYSYLKYICQRWPVSKYLEEIPFHRHCQARLIHHFNHSQTPWSMHMIQCRIRIRPRYFIKQIRPTWPRQNVTRMTQIAQMTRPGFNPDTHQPK